MAGISPPWRSLLFVSLALASISIASAKGRRSGELALAAGDVFTGQYEGMYDDGDGRFEIRIHSPTRGAAVVTQDAAGASIGHMTHCDTLDVIDCAGVPLETPVFGYLNVTAWGAATAVPATSLRTSSQAQGVSSTGAGPGTVGATRPARAKDAG
eukprot:CAMPEP_0169426768 /NCGR_PEP_ID=MMETSP1042-20121227/396_1 /TAXON_ID=464988 /ORGANISM="Hemiselmis andersenii, Strain CCMP1180" /LENGTH=154 /DNA_ID=CAMNT_0009536747 /DNA_START=11 /DNA_END=472 /DNA_ORIENTATION=+